MNRAIPTTISPKPNQAEDGLNRSLGSALRGSEPRPGYFLWETMTGRAGHWRCPATIMRFTANGKSLRVRLK